MNVGFNYTVLFITPFTVAGFMLRNIVFNTSKFLAEFGENSLSSSVSTDQTHLLYEDDMNNDRWYFFFKTKMHEFSVCPTVTL